jgi:hypothetical protein
MRKLQQLGNQVKIKDLLERFREWTELPIGGDLFQVGFRQSEIIIAVILVRSMNNHFTVFPNVFMRQQHPAQSPGFLLETDSIAPESRFIALPIPQFDFDFDIGIPSGGETPQFSKTTSQRDRLLKAAPSFRDVPQKAKRIEEIGFSTRIRPGDEKTLAKLQINPREVPPVLELQPRELHASRVGNFDEVIKLVFLLQEPADSFIPAIGIQRRNFSDQFFLGVEFRSSTFPEWPHAAAPLG